LRNSEIVTDEEAEKEYLHIFFSYLAWQLSLGVDVLATSLHGFEQYANAHLDGNQSQRRRIRRIDPHRAQRARKGDHGFSPERKAPRKQSRETVAQQLQFFQRRNVVGRSRSEYLNGASQKSSSFTETDGGGKGKQKRNKRERVGTIGKVKEWTAPQLRNDKRLDDVQTG